jgi:hypothetical protein
MAKEINIARLAVDMIANTGTYRSQLAELVKQTDKRLKDLEKVHITSNKQINDSDTSAAAAAARTAQKRADDEIKIAAQAAAVAKRSSEKLAKQKITAEHAAYAESTRMAKRKAAAEVEIASQATKKLNAITREREQALQKSARRKANYAVQAGFQLQDVMVQAQGGIAATTIVAQQGSQFLGAFGAAGALAGAALAGIAVGVGIFNKSGAAAAAQAKKTTDEVLALAAAVVKLDNIGTTNLDKILNSQTATEELIKLSKLIKEQRELSANAAKEQANNFIEWYDSATKRSFRMKKDISAKQADIKLVAQVNKLLNTQLNTKKALEGIVSGDTTPENIAAKKTLISLEKELAILTDGEDKYNAEELARQNVKKSIIDDIAITQAKIKTEKEQQAAATAAASKLAADKLAANNLEKSNQKSIKQTIDLLKIQTANYGKSSSAIAVYNASLKNASTEQKKEIKLLTEEFEEKKKTVALDKKKTADAETLLNKKKADNLVVKKSIELLRVQIANYGHNNKAIIAYTDSLSGANPELLKQQRILKNIFDDKKESIKIEEDAAKLVESNQKSIQRTITLLKQQNAMYGKSAAAIAMYKASLKNATPEQKAEILKETEDLEGKKRDAQVKKDATKQAEDLAKLSQNSTDGVSNPAAKYIAEQNLAQANYDAGKISKELYEQAMLGLTVKYAEIGTKMMHDAAAEEKRVNDAKISEARRVESARRQALSETYNFESSMAQTKWAKISLDSEREAELIKQRNIDQNAALVLKYGNDYLADENYLLEKSELTKRYNEEIIASEKRVISEKGSAAMGDLDQIAGAFGEKLKLQETYAKSEAAITATQAAVQVWVDPKLSFYEKIPASIAAGAAVAQLAGQFHGGTDAVPESMNNKSFMLKAGERVVQPEANKKLTKFLDTDNQTQSSGKSATTITQNINGSAMMSKQDFDELLSRSNREIAALNHQQTSKRSSTSKRSGR